MVDRNQQLIRNIIIKCIFYPRMDLLISLNYDFDWKFTRSVIIIIFYDGGGQIPTISVKG